jgi:hypothetical protein
VVTVTGRDKIRQPFAQEAIATSWGRWRLAGAAGGARVGSHVVRDGGDACADCRNATFGRAARPCAEYGDPAWCLRGVANRLRSTVPAREFGGIEVRKRRAVCLFNKQDDA